MPRRYFLQTLGCKLNQADTARLAAELDARGMQPVSTPAQADLMVVNTCTVTSRADADGRHALRRLRRANPDARLIAMGCTASRDPRSLSALDGVDVVSPGCDPRPVIRAAMAAFPGDIDAGATPYHIVPTIPGRTRAYLKVQDGCDLACAYCIIPSVRGRSRSIPAAEIEASLARLIGAGFVEVVLTGVNTGDWGRDLPGAPRLLDLLQRLVSVPGLGRLRLNSLEPRTVDDPLIEWLAGEPRMAPHLQIPLQSGSDSILARMRRNYRRGFYRDLLARLERALPGIGLGADVIVGFPSESEADFSLTETLVEESPLAYLHVFSYSARPGTDAADLPDPVDPAVIRERATRLRKLAARKGTRFRRRHIGRTVEVITLEDARPDGRIRSLTGNFFEVLLPAGSARANRLVPVRIVSADASGARGIPVAA
ncbi:MAG: tRNA (N(6)-L-threonylcarbamoyladenosine(37)-C(2))-methylthiotransferase MtaB [Acidobacteriota bacterium]